MGMKYYFGYGSNMSLEQMKDRCPQSEFVKVAYLKGYKFVYDGYSSTRKGAVANVIKGKKEDIVHGALYQITEDDEKRLDKYEGYPKYYDKREFIVEDDEGNKYSALIYYRNPLKVGIPSEEYENIVVTSAEKLGLPEDYIRNYLKVRTSSTS